MKIALGILFIINLFIVSCSPKGMTQTDSRPVVDRITAKTSSYSFAGAVKYKFKGDISSALDMLLFSIEVDSTNAAAYSELSNYSTYFKENGKSQDLMKKAISLEPDNIWYKYKLADYYTRTDSLKEAASVYEDVLRVKGNDTSLYYLLCSYYIKLEEYKKAISILEKLEKKEGETFDIFSEKIKLYSQTEGDEKVISELERRMAENPDELPVQMLLSQMYMVNGMNDKAGSLFQSMLEKNPDSEEVNAAVIGFYEKNDSVMFRKRVSEIVCGKDFSEELKDFVLTRVLVSEKTKNDTVFLDSMFKDAISSISFDDTAVLIKYAQYLQMNGKTDDMIPVLEEVFRRNPTIEVVNYTLFSYYLEKADNEGVFVHSAQGMKNAPQELFYYFYNALHYLENKDYGKVIEVCTAAVQYITKDSQTELVSYIYSIMASSYHETGEDDKCFAACEKALMYSPNNPTMLNDYAYFLALAGKDIEKAEELAYKAVGFSPEDVNILDTYAWVMFVKGDYAVAQEYIEKALSLSDKPGDTIYEHAGDIYIMNGMPDKAVEMWKKAKEAGSESKTLDMKIKQKKYIKGE